MDPKNTVPVPEPRPVTQPVMDIMPPRPAETVKTPPPEVPSPVPAPSDTPAAKAKPIKPPKVQTSKQPRTGVGLAVAATVIIILGLAAMMTYAYLRTQGINIF